MVNLSLLTRYLVIRSLLLYMINTRLMLLNLLGILVFYIRADVIVFILNYFPESFGIWEIGEKNCKAVWKWVWNDKISLLFIEAITCRSYKVGKENSFEMIIASKYDWWYFESIFCHKSVKQCDYSMGII